MKSEHVLIQSHLTKCPYCFAQYGDEAFWLELFVVTAEVGCSVQSGGDITIESESCRMIVSITAQNMEGGFQDRTKEDLEMCFVETMRRDLPYVTVQTLKITKITYQCSQCTLELPERSPEYLSPKSKGETT